MPSLLELVENLNFMKSRIFRYLAVFCVWTIIFLLQKPIFLVFYGYMLKHCGVAELCSTLWHGLSLDLSMAGYLTLLPILGLAISVWSTHEWLRWIGIIYFVLTTLCASAAFVLNLALYKFWGFPLDSTPLFYFFSSPKDALASVSLGFIVMGCIAWLLTAVALFFPFYLSLRKTQWQRLMPPRRRLWTTLVMLLLMAILLLPIRGGFTASTTNTGKAYFSDETVLNHAAVNPLFSLLESFSESNDFRSQYRFMDDAQADSLFQTLVEPAHNAVTPVPKALFTNRPNVLFIVMESFSAKLMTELGGEPNIAINLDSIARQGILFTRFYANSFRTDRGLLSILSGYPAQPTMSLMKFPQKTANLPSLCHTLRSHGYVTKYYYGGDADFTNMRSYLVSQGFTDIVSDVDFPFSQRLSKWGVHDAYVFQRALLDISCRPSIKPFFYVIQTSSSHEPFEVPYHRLNNERLNAFAYADSCIGAFLRQFATLTQWENTLVVLVADHLGCYPEDIDNRSPERYHIPLIMTGGVINTPQRIDVIGSQQDIAATVLSMLGLPHNDLRFSVDMRNSAAPHFAFFTFPDLFGFITSDTEVVHDNLAKKVVYRRGSHPERNLRLGQAYLQKLYDDIADR